MLQGLDFQPCILDNALKYTNENSTRIAYEIDGKDSDKYEIKFDDSWRENDGLVNTVSGRNPFDEPAKEYDGEVESGIWNIMPTLICDHGGAAGLFANKKELHKFYENLAEMLIKTEK